MVDEEKWIAGMVVRGSGRGRRLGWPTANIRLSPGKERPAEGVYACWVKLADGLKRWRGALHSGPRLTFNETQPTVEIHLLDWPSRELYGQEISFCCVAYLRPVRRFASRQQLAAAIARDCQMARAVLG